MPRVLVLKNWRKFQHYTDRKPPWIKLYVDLLDDLAYLGMSDAAQAGLPRVWLLAARVGHPLPYDIDLIAGKAVLKRRTLLELIEKGWLVEENASTDASAGSPEPLEESSPLARADAPSRQRSEDRELPLPDDRVRASLTAEHHVAAFDALGARSRSPSLLYELRLLAEGGERIGKGMQEAHGWPVVGEALHQLVVAGGSITPAALQAFIRRIVAPTANGRTKHDDTDAEIRRGVETLKALRATNGQ